MSPNRGSEPAVGMADDPSAVNSRGIWLAAFGLALVAVGVCHAALSYGLPEWAVPIWPTYIVAAGTAWIILGFLDHRYPSVVLITVGAVSSTIGLLLLFQLGTHGSAFWLFTWPLPPLSAAFFVFVYSVLRRDAQLMHYVLKPIVVLIALFCVSALIGWAYIEVASTEVRTWDSWVIAMIVIVIGLLLIAAGYWFGHVHGADGAANEEPR